MPASASLLAFDTNQYSRQLVQKTVSYTPAWLRATISSAWQLSGFQTDIASNVAKARRSHTPANNIRCSEVPCRQLPSAVQHVHTTSVQGLSYGNHATVKTANVAAQLSSTLAGKCMWTKQH